MEFQFAAKFFVRVYPKSEIELIKIVIRYKVISVIQANFLNVHQRS
ncbi:MAG: hypothetical protein CLLPBCKN_007855 [Chroococcidiopsis cubana SAG 39.79]|jgi:hypothetical protein|nr:hypothetical protein [Chroococcidiopsis cubana SAG 39.79]